MIKIKNILDKLSVIVFDKLFVELEFYQVFILGLILGLVFLMVCFLLWHIIFKS